MKYERLTYRIGSIVETNWKQEKILDRLAELEDKIESGKMLELPCLREHKISTLHGDIIQKEMVYITKNDYIDTMLYGDDEFEEAERRLAELKGE